MATSSADIQQVIRLTASSDVKAGLDVAKRDIQRAMGDAVFAPKGLITGAKQFGDEMVKQGQRIKGSFAGLRQGIFDITGIALGVGAIMQVGRFAFRSISSEIEAVIEGSAAVERSLRMINAHLVLANAKSDTLGESFKKAAENLSPQTRETFGRSGFFGGIEAEAAGLAQLGAQFRISAGDTERFASAALILKRNLGTDLNEAMIAILRSSKGSADGFQQLGDILGDEVKNLTDFERALRKIAVLDLERQINTLGGRKAAETAGGSIGAELRELIDKSDRVSRNNVLDPKGTTAARETVIQREIDAYKRLLAQMADVQARRDELQLMEDKGHVAGIAQDIRSAEQREANLMKVRAGVEYVADGLGELGAAALRSSEDFKQAAQSIISDLVAMTVKWAVFRIVTGIFGGGGTGAAYDPAMGLEPVPESRRLGGYIGGRGVTSFASGGVAGITNGPTYLLGDNSSGREAVVPLPDGRRIPVEMRGGGGGGVVIHNHIQAIDTQSLIAALSTVKSASAKLLLAVLDEEPTIRQGIRGT